MCSIDIFVNLQPVCWDLKEGLFYLPISEVRGNVDGRGWAYSIACPWFPISFPLTHKVHLLPFVSYLAGSKSYSVRPSNTHTMTNTTPKLPLCRAAILAYDRPMGPYECILHKHSFFAARRTKYIFYSGNYHRIWVGQEWWRVGGCTENVMVK